jgi:hypothetical protein
MKRIWRILLLASAGRTADVTLWTSGQVIVDNVVQCAANYQAARIFSRIGVSLEWTKERPAALDGPGIEVRYATGVLGHPESLAFSTPFESRPVITVLYDRILASTERVTRDLRATLLAHVLAHEIGHILMRTDAHSSQGLMKAHWTSSDFARMFYRPLPFLPVDEDAIRRGLAELDVRVRVGGTGAALSGRRPVE